MSEAARINLVDRAPLTENAEYLLSFEMQAEAGSHMKVLLNGEEHDIALSEKQIYSVILRA